MLYPFAWVNRPTADGGGRRRLHAGALRRSPAAGGIAAIRGALIDDCALGAPSIAGPIRLGLTERVNGFRYSRRSVTSAAWSPARPMPSSATPLVLGGTVAGMALTYLAPVLLAIFARGLPEDSWPAYMGADGDCVPADAPALSPFAAMGPRAAADCAAIR